MVMPKVAPAPTVVNAAPAPANSAGTANSTGVDTTDAAGEQFAQLLDHADTQPDERGAPNPKEGRIADNGAAVSTSALAAQEISAEIRRLQGILQQVITPVQAQGLLGEISTALSQHQGGKHEKDALAQLKAQLQQIVDTGESRSVAQMLAALELPAGDAPANEPAASPIGQRLVSWLQKALGKQTSRETETPTQDDADVVAHTHAVTAAMQSLQASLFRATDGQNPAQGQGQQQQEGTDTVVRVVPLASSLLVAQAAPVEEVSTTALAQQGRERRTDLDAAIPPLTLAKTEALPKDTSLPEIDLPRLASSAANTRDDAARAADAQSAATKLTSTEMAASTANALSIVQRLQAALDASADASSSVVAARAPEKTPDSNPASDGTAMAAAAAAVAAKANALAPVAVDEAPKSSVAAVEAGNNNVLNPSLIGGHSPAHSAAAVQPGTASFASHLVNHAPVTDQVKVAITQAKSDGVERITIQLDPAELGRVEVKMHTGSDGQTQVLFTIDKPSTFDALSRDARSLERSLQDAGIKADAGSMQFNLRQQPQTQLQSGLGGQQGQPAPFEQSEEEESVAAVGAASSAAAMTRHYRVDVREGLDIRA